MPAYHLRSSYARSRLASELGQQLVMQIEGKGAGVLDSQENHKA